MILINKRRATTSLARRPTYLARLARSADEVRAAQRLRFEVFNLELNEGQGAATNIGYYSEREFDFSPYEPLRNETIELGRACVHTDHRNFNLLHLLWRGI